MVNLEFRKVCEFFRTNRLVLHPDKTNFVFFSRTNIGREVKIFGNNNNEGQTCAENISIISRVSSTDDTPAVKFLGVFFNPALNFTYLNLKLNCQKPCTP